MQPGLSSGILAQRMSEIFFFSKTGVFDVSARARRDDISGNIAPIDLKFLGMIKTPNLSLLAKFQINWAKKTFFLKKV